MTNRSRSPKPVSPSVELSTLRASETGTAGFRRRFEPQVVGDYFRATPFGLNASSIGIGTYLGDTTDSDDVAYEGAVHGAIGRGVNLIDTAINYRGQRSERAIGAAIQRLIASSDAKREELIVCSKGGYIPLDRQAPATR